MSTDGHGVPKSTNSSTDHLPSAMKQSSSRPTSPSPQSTTLAANDMTTPTASSTATTDAWQAIFSPQHNAYYFYNIQTNETTWTNPLQPPPAADAAPEPTSSSAEAQATSHHAALQAAAEAAGIDPSLAYLDPSLVGGPVVAGGSAPNTFTAKFNARTGAFTAGDARDPGHLSEYEVSVGFYIYYRFDSLPLCSDAHGVPSYQITYHLSI